MFIRAATLWGARQNQGDFSQLCESPTTVTTIIGSSSSSSNIFGLLWIILKAETMEELTSILNLGITINFLFVYLNNFYQNGFKTKFLSWSCRTFLVRSASKIIQKDFGYNAALQSLGFVEIFFTCHIYFSFQVLFLSPPGEDGRLFCTSTTPNLAETHIISWRASLKTLLRAQVNLVVKWTPVQRIFSSLKFAVNQSRQLSAVSNDCAFVKIILGECDGSPTLSK